MIIGDCGADGRHTYGEYCRGTEALQSPESDQEAVRGGQATDQRRPGEDHQARHDDPAMAAQIAKPTSRNHGRTYRDHVGTEHPLHIRGGLVEVDRHLRQRQAEREEIDLHTEHADRERNHRPDLGRS